ncbi:Uncharacterised protein [uncultured archaeon]|nr:Uncharacterised protein [uncultured archaeon]
MTNKNESRRAQKGHSLKPFAIRIEVEGVMKGDPINKVKFRPKSPDQKDDCINRSAEYDCPNPSTLEAVRTMDTHNCARIRCCADERCMRRAAELALDARPIG